MLVKQFELSEKDALLSFLRTAYADNPRMSDERFWNWHFLENPYTAPDNLPIWIAKENEEIVAQLAATLIKLKIGAAEKPSMWILDLIVRPDFRRRGLGKKLAAEAVRFCPLGLGMNTAEQHSTALLESVGWKMIGRIPRYGKLLFPGEALKEISGNRLLRRAANFTFAPMRSKYTKQSLRQMKNLRVVENFDASFDELWRAASAHRTCAVAREKVLLDWQYKNQPGKKFDVLGFYENEKLHGYIVLYFRRKESNGALSKAAITDVLYHPSKAQTIVDALINGALRLAVERRAGALVTDVLDNLVQKRLEYFGFSRVKNPLQLLVKNPEQNPTLEDLNEWFITRGDSDTSIFEEPNF